MGKNVFFTKLKMAENLVSFPRDFLSSKRGLMLDVASVASFLLAVDDFLLLISSQDSETPEEEPRGQHTGNSTKKKAFKIVLINLVYIKCFVPSMVYLYRMGKL